MKNILIVLVLVAATVANANTQQTAEDLIMLDEGVQSMLNNQSINSRWSVKIIEGASPASYPPSTMFILKATYQDRICDFNVIYQWDRQANKPKITPTGKNCVWTSPGQVVDPNKTISELIE